ncbi:DUF6631 family protein [[Haemophilus] ducreyi]|uniref:DUF6631 family protein n=1 Tax=Haemophilus ducreyi TaxID=730 RepID=UPI00065661D6|nr:DUF6631 family protein [[Haemophilus] ducreyi]AKO44815.1 hypothetical protein RZ66_00480 [[Haemophilus] ducreyi]AKO46217.1 hypothetical protein RZ67_00445 [[Haemophilus] ducreyi]AKO47558.1 hypothetical protein RZ68_00440 [[Haemophilus] ducreyi]AKO48945.1 hypothetical protein RZ69_00475 [[Haemophilus] ducreyi]ANF61614.1 hypothetical protein A6037_02055 [[Haemophilus] ducreyi]
MQKEKDELNVLFPHQKLTIAGEEIEVKEYSLIQQLQHRALFMPFVTDLRTTLSQADTQFGLDPLMSLLAEHYQDVLTMVSLSINKPLEWVQNLTGENAETVLMMWWTVNSDFFTRQALQPMLEKAVLQQAQKQK